MLEVTNLRLRLSDGQLIPNLSKTNLFFSDFSDTGLSFRLKAGETLGLIGPSGTGKTLLSLAIMDLLPVGVEVASGEIKYKDLPLTNKTRQDWAKLRGNKLEMAFQDPLKALTPHLTIGEQLAEVLVYQKGKSWAEAMEQSAELLAMLGIRAPIQRLQEFPFQLSGGMRQRVMLAMALAGEPEVLIADEPTSALDYSTGYNLLETLRAWQEKQGMAIILISHEFQAIKSMCHEVVTIM